MNKPYLPPKGLNLDWDIIGKKKEMECLKLKEICPRRNHSFHSSTTEHEKSILNKSFEKSQQDTRKSSYKIENEFGLLKQLINSRKVEIEKQEMQQQFKEKMKEQSPISYHTFKPVFDKLSTLIEQSNVKYEHENKIKTRLSTIFDTMEIESQRGQKSEKVDTLLNLIENLMKDCIIPIMAQQSSSSQQIVQSRIQYTITNSKLLLDQLCEQLQATSTSGYLKYCIQSGSACFEQVNNFNYNRNQQLRLINMHFKEESKLDIPLKQLKQCVINQNCNTIGSIVIMPLQINDVKLIYILKGVELLECQKQQSILQGQLNTFAINQQLKILQLSIIMSKYYNQQQIIAISLITKYGNKKQAIYKIIKRIPFNQIKYYAKRQVQMKHKLTTLMSILSTKQSSSSMQLTNELSHCCKQLRLKEQYRLNKLVSVIQQQQQLQLALGFRLLNGNDDQMIMLQAFQQEGSLEKYLKQIMMLLGEKLFLTILNSEVQTMTAYLPDMGLIQEYHEEIDELSKYDTLYQLTQSVHTDLVENGIEFEYRHIWQVSNGLYIITLSNMNSQYLSKIALVITNAIQYLQNKYLDIFRFLRMTHKNSQIKYKSIFFNKWRNSRHQQYEIMKQELYEHQQQMRFEQDMSTRSTCEQQLEIQKLHLQNAIKSKCLSSAMLQNCLSKIEMEQKLKEYMFRQWRSTTKQHNHINARFQTAMILMNKFSQQIQNNLINSAFREIAFTNCLHLQQPGSPLLKNTKRSVYNTNREPTRRSQEDLEQSILWDVHQMKLHAPNHMMTSKVQTLSPMTNQTMNSSLQFNDCDPVYQFHSQRTYLDQYKNKTQKKRVGQQDQENTPSENRIYSKKAKDFVRKITQPNHQRFNSVQAGSAFSFYAD